MQNNLTEETKNQLMAAGLSKQQVNSQTTEALFNIFMNEDEKILIQEARRKVNEMTVLVSSLRSEYHELKKEIETVAGTWLDIAKAQEEHGALTDERAKNAVSLYASILKMNERTGAEGKYSVKAASYAIYSYLSQQGNHDILDDKPKEYND